LGARTARGSLVDKVLVVASAATIPIRATIPTVAAPASVSTSTVPVTVAARATLPAAVFFASLWDELAEGVFGTFVVASVRSVEVAVLDPGGRRFGVSAVRIVPLGEGSLVRGLLLLIGGTAYKGSRDEPSEDQERQDTQDRRYDLIVVQQTVPDAGDHRQHAALGGSALGIEKL
jgi:hypothetical protein